MTKDELLEAMKRGAVVFVNVETGETKIQAQDDLPPDMRQCIRISRAANRIPCKDGVRDMSTPEAKAIWEERLRHKAECPSCLEAEAAACIMDAASHREHGNETIARELEADAAELRLRAANYRARGRQT